MPKLQRSSQNPILLPSINNEWEAAGAFNGCVTKYGDKYIMLYRAMTQRKPYLEANLEVSSIGHAESPDGIHFTNHRMLLGPEEHWERYGCEDPRITKIGDDYFIFYTALSGFPFSSANIKVALAITRDFKKFEKHTITPFNAKAMALFPDKVDGKYAAILTANTDIPPSKIGIALFDQLEEIWSESYWNSWYIDLESHTLNLLRNDQDQVEVGAPPIKTDRGWLIIYSYIKDYLTPDKKFGIEALLLDLNDPMKVIGRTDDAMILPETRYELYGNIPNVIFPSGALVKDDNLYVYYGAADTSTAVATCKLEDLMKEITPVKEPLSAERTSYFERFDENPILLPVKEHSWESLAVYNPAAIYEDGLVHILYRAEGPDHISTMGYATSLDGLHIHERLPYPVYVPRADFEMKKVQGNSGCEDPRIVRIDDRYYVCYTAFDGGVNPPRVALTSIKVQDFLKRNWDWADPIIVSPPGVDDKDACLFPKKINGKYVFFHRISGNIWIDFLDDLKFKNDRFLGGEILFEPKKESWDNHKIGIAGPPIETEKGWLLLYHGIDARDERVYKVGAVLLDLEQPSKVLKWLDFPLFEPETQYELEGQVPNVVFPCGQVVIDGVLYLYYGGADSVVGVAKMKLQEILDLFTK